MASPKEHAHKPHSFLTTVLGMRLFLSPLRGGGDRQTKVLDPVTEPASRSITWQALGSDACVQAA